MPVGVFDLLDSQSLQPGRGRGQGARALAWPPLHPDVWTCVCSYEYVRVKFDF